MLNTRITNSRIIATLPGGRSIHEIAIVGMGTAKLSYIITDATGKQGYIFSRSELEALGETINACSAKGQLRDSCPASEWQALTQPTTEEKPRKRLW